MIYFNILISINRKLFTSADTETRLEILDMFLNLFMLSILHYNKVFQPYNK